MALTLSEYAALAQRTASTKTAEEKIGHGLLGLIGEAGEIVDIVKKMKYMGMPEAMAKEKIIDEAGDLFWYVVEECAGMGWKFEELVVNSIGCPEDVVNGPLERYAVNMVGEAVECLRHEAILRMQHLVEVIWIAWAILRLNGLDVTDVLEHNIEKLRARYPDGFSADKSNERYA